VLRLEAYCRVKYPGRIYCIVGPTRKIGPGEAEGQIFFENIPPPTVEAEKPLCIGLP